LIPAITLKVRVKMISYELNSLLNEIISYELIHCLSEIDLMGMAQFNGLQGFKRLHRYSARDRLEHAIFLVNHIVEYNKSIPELKLTYSSSAAKPANVLDSLKIEYQKSEEQISRLKSASKMAIAESEDFLMHTLECLIRDEMKESIRISRAIQEISNTGNNTTFVQLLDSKIHDKYKSKEKDMQAREY